MEFQTPIKDLLMHVALHGSYHRGQIAQALRLAGGEPVNTDFITFVRESEKKTISHENRLDSREHF
jgi:uncharacterized damage-inducible protein DinB